MNADTITTSTLDDLEALLIAARATIRRVRLQADSGEISTQNAAAIVKETAEMINNFCKD